MHYLPVNLNFPDFRLKDNGINAAYMYKGAAPFGLLCYVTILLLYIVFTVHNSLIDP